MASTPGSPTDQYRGQQGIAPITQSTDPTVVKWIEQAAKATGADPNALLATSIQESGARRGQVGDNGTSFGPFQHHIHGALGNHPPAWANTYAAVFERAQQFAKDQVHHGVGAAAVQKPLDRQLYARGVDSHMEQARRIIERDLGLLEQDKQKKKKPPSAQPTASDTKAVGDIPQSELLSALMSNAKMTHLPGSSAVLTGNPVQDALNRNAAIAGVSAPTLPTPQLDAAPTPAAKVRPKAKKVKPAFTAPAALTPGGGWGGTQKLADALKALGVANGLGATGKRQRMMTASGNVSDHYIGNKTAFAYDLSNGSHAPDAAKDKTAMSIANALGAGAQWAKQGHAGVLNVTIGGYRYQMLYRTNVGGNHFNHVHIGVKKL